MKNTLRLFTAALTLASGMFLTRLDAASDPTSDDGDTDKDRDFASNLDEYRAGTRADDPRSKFALTQSTMTGNALGLRWQSVPNLTYRLVTRSSLNGPIRSTMLIPSQGTETQVTFPPGNSTRFISLQVK